MARKKKAAVAAIPTGRNLSIFQLESIGACETAIEAFRSIFGEKVRITPRTVSKLTDEQVALLGRVSSYWILSENGQNAFGKTLSRFRRRFPWNLGYAKTCRRHLSMLARAYIRYPRRFA